METRKDRMANEYAPKLHDYVIWHHNKTTEEGWVYFAGDEYICIEVGVKEKPICDLTSHHKHRKNHTLIVCQNWYWHELEYVKHRRTREILHYSQYDDVNQEEPISKTGVEMYKSQEGRLQDY